jgi:membrane-anchored glycerophosphoryl diester phosphodiesterase (GDPDase)
MNRLKRSWRLAMASWSVLRADWTLLRFPIISSILSTIMGVLVVLILWGAGVFDSVEDTEATASGDGSLLTYVGVFILYLVTSFVVIYCNTALISLVMARFNGRPDDPDTGWAAARARWKHILRWAAISATVGVLLNVLSDRGGRVGEIVAAVGAAAWGLATFLVIPALVVEKVGPIDAMKRSATMLKRTWGEQIVGNAGIGLVTGLMVVLVIIVGGGLIALAAMTGNAAVIVAAVIPVVIAVAVVIAISSALGAIYQAAVYRYAAGEQAEGFGDPALLANAFTTK